MMLGRYKQQPRERIKRIIDLTKWLEATEEIQTVTAVCTPVTDTPFECSLIVVDPAAKKFAYYLEGGEDGNTYVATFTVTTQTQVREDEIEVDVEEVE